MKKKWFFLPLLLLFSFLISAPLEAFTWSGCCPQWGEWCKGWVVYGDYLYWSYRRCGLDYAVPADSSNVTIGDVFEIEPSYASGYRVGGAKRLGCWDLGVRYTWYHTDDSDSTFSATGELGPTQQYSVALVPFVPAGNVQEASAKYRINLDVGDVELGYLWERWACRTLRLFGGFKYARIDQKLSVEYVENSATPDRVFVRAKTELDTYGMYGGIDGTQEICGFCNHALDFGLTGSLSFGVLFGDTHRRRVEFAIEDDGTFTEAYNLTDQCDRLIGNLNTAFGLYLTSCVSPYCSSIDLFVGYEFHIWLNTPDFFSDFQSDPQQNLFLRNDETLGFDGLFARIAFTF